MKSLYAVVMTGLLALGTLVSSVPAKQEAVKGPGGPTIYEIASGLEDFSILTFALEATGLDDVLDGKGQYTVFAPNDEAFDAAAADLGLTIEELVNLLVANPAYLTEVLVYHVAPGRRDSANVLASTKIRTLQGGFLKQSGGTLTDNVGRDVNIIQVDIMASNGIIHVLDNVVLPSLP
jgi:uncharacterized surface protein with fasciclin (FAS1) repeats